MKQEEFEKLLITSFDDSKLSHQEKSNLRGILNEENLSLDSLNFIRNKAFQIVYESYHANKSIEYDALKWLEGIIRTLDSAKSKVINTRNDSYFSPGQDCVQKIIRLIERANNEIDICVFTISDNEISKALMAAYKNKKKIRIITDNDKTQDLGSDIECLAREGLEVKIDQSPNHMHHKFAIFDQKILVNGSFNWTRSASRYNQENIVVSNDIRLIESFQENFLSLWKSCVKY
ncbi:phospholipase D-like domain-containing protein [Aliikangiella sp. IMCC44359]|uniref:phospholipase D-like domain-containing protein n=1 Tax=Aliikangiella sp. IMCC44359 TaxID=3459125 RepID=UPI00403AABFB